MQSMTQTAIWLSKGELKTLKEVMPPRSISPMFRKIVQSIIADAEIPHGLPPRTLELVRNTQDDMKLVMLEYERQQSLKDDMYRFFKDRKIPNIYIKNGDKVAIKAALELIPEVRGRGHIIPYCHEKQYVKEYLRWINITGVVAEVTKEMQDHNMAEQQSIQANLKKQLMEAPL